MRETQIPLRLAFGRLAVIVAVAAVIVGSAACGDDDDKDVEADIRADLAEHIAAEASGDAEAYLQHVTDHWLAKVLGATADEVRADSSLFQSDEPVELGDIEVSGDKATVQFTDPDTSGHGRFDYRTAVGVVKEGGVWKLDSLHVSSAASVPSDAKKIDIQLTDFAFGFSRKEITSTDDLVFQLENTGKQYHMLVAAQIPVDADLDEILAYEGEGSPPGVEDIGGVYLLSPGDKAEVVLDGRLAPGRYVFLCFVSDEDDPEHTPHFLEGMLADFTVE